MSFSELKTTHMHGLVLRMREEDAEAADHLIRAAVGRMEALARHELRRSPVIRRWAEAEDVLQNALLRLRRALYRAQPASMREFHDLAAEMIRRETLDLAPQPGMAELESLIGRVRASGLPVELVVTGSPDTPMPDGVVLAG